MKKFFRKALAQCGYQVSHLDSDPVLTKLDQARDLLRLHPGKPAVWQHALAQLALSSHLRGLLKIHRPDLVIDVGANRGQFALLLRELGYSGPILSIEAQLALADSLRIRAAASDPTWVVVHGAAGDSVGELVLHTYADDTFSSFHHPNARAIERFGPLLTPAAPESVPVRHLDSWFSDSAFASATRIFLKTDTQGHDSAVLRGASKTLDRAVVVLAEGSVVPLYDTAATPEALSAFLAPLGFRPAGTYAVSYGDKDLAALELDCLFIRTAS